MDFAGKLQQLVIESNNIAWLSNQADFKEEVNG